jgi:hypothetical protein
MKEITNTSKLQKPNHPINKRTPAPSMISGQKGTVIKPLSNLTHLVKNNSSIHLENRKVGKYSLKRFEEHDQESTKQWLTFSYKLNKTRYKVKSVTYITFNKKRDENVEGEVEISKGFWNVKKFKVKDLPQNVVSSINDNINIFNEEWNKLVSDQQNSEKVKKEQEKNKFFEGLDT